MAVEVVKTPKKLYAQLILGETPENGTSIPNQLMLVRNQNDEVINFKIGKDKTDWNDIKPLFHNKSDVYVKTEVFTQQETKQEIQNYAYSKDNVYKKEETFSQQEINGLINNISTLVYNDYDALINNLPQEEERNIGASVFIKQANFPNMWVAENNITADENDVRIPSSSDDAINKLNTNQPILIGKYLLYKTKEAKIINIIPGEANSTGITQVVYDKSLSFSFTNKNRNAAHLMGVNTPIYVWNAGNAEVPYGASETSFIYNEEQSTIQPDTTTGYNVSLGGRSAAIGTHSLSFGDYCIAWGDNSNAQGENVVSLGTSSHAEGVATTSYGYGSHAEGYNTIAFGNYSHAEGENTTSHGEGSHAEGGNNNSNGGYSHTEGLDNSTTGESSHVEGEGNEIYALDLREDPEKIKQGLAAHAEGGLTKVCGNYAHAEGYDTQATGEKSHSEGSQTIASGCVSHAEGFSSQAIGDYSHAEGSNTSALGDTSHTEGSNTRTDGLCSHAEGYSTNAVGDYSHAEGGYTAALGNNSHAEGCNTKVFGEASHIEGKSSNITDINNYITYNGLIDTWNTKPFSIAYGDAAHTEGQDNIAYGSASHAEGCNTKTKGDYSHAEGYGTNALGFYSHAEGSNTRTDGLCSHAEGYSTRAEGAYSHASGQYTHAFLQSQSVVGEYNDKDRTNRKNDGTPLFVVGAGQNDENRRNAFEVITRSDGVTDLIIYIKNEEYDFEGYISITKYFEQLFANGVVDPNNIADVCPSSSI